MLKGKLGLYYKAKICLQTHQILIEVITYYLLLERSKSQTQIMAMYE